MFSWSSKRGRRPVGLLACTSGSRMIRAITSKHLDVLEFFTEAKTAIVVLTDTLVIGQWGFLTLLNSLEHGEQ